MPSKPASAAHPDIIPLLRAAFDRHQAGDTQSAKSAYDAALAQAPDHPEALYLSGALDHQLGNQTDAIPKLERSLAARPNHLPALEMLGAAAAKAARFELAAKCFAAAAAQKPDSRDLHYNHGVVLFQAGHYEDAAIALRRALALTPNYGDALYFLANALRLQNRHQAAAEVYGRLISIQPLHAHALDEFGGVLFNLGRTEDAERVIQQAIAAAPEMANPYTNLGRLYHTDASQAQTALTLHDQAIARAPDHAEAHNNRGVALQLMGRPEDALASYDKTIALKPNHAEAHRNKGLTALMLRRWQEGWKENEWRFKCPDASIRPRTFSQPIWNGKDAGGTLLVWGEHGIGDEILYAGMIGDLVDRGYSVAWEMDARLQPLIARSYPRVCAIARHVPADPATTAPNISAQISAASLGQYLRSTVDSFPTGRRNYLRADESTVTAFRRRLTADGATRVIGVSWMSTNERFGPYKSCQLKTWQPLWAAAGPQTRFVDLQYGDTTQERAQSGLDILHLDDLDLMNDIDRLAALITACDQVVSVSNTTAHLSCALNVSTAVLVPIGNGQLWYWGHEGTDTPWYPSATIYRQRQSGRWDDVLASVAQGFITPP